MTLSLPDFADVRVLVVGDVMLDRYWHGDTGRISPEAPVPVVRVGEAEERVGGAGNVGVNVAALAGAATVVGPVGEDEAGHLLAGRLEAEGCRAALVPVEDWPTITKLRVLSRHQQLIRLDFEQPLPAAARARLFAAFEAALADCDVVVLSDYAKGALADPRPFIRAARERGRPVIVDPKRADLGAYAGATLVTPNRAEFEQAAGAFADEAELTERGRALLAETGIGGLLVTRSEAGMSLVVAGVEPLHLAARAREVFDVTGAGDTVVAVLAAAMGAGETPERAAMLANLAAGLVVGKLGTASVSAAELGEAVAGPAGEHGVVEPGRLEVLLAEARRRGERVVMTNGCFDILHPGHVAYLEEAARLGDRLVVAVNDDASVARLKGPERPVNPLEQRMAVLAGLRSVDWVVPFAEDTPRELICRLGPDLLVKGGDYAPGDVAGGDCVRAAGGEVVILGFREGFSTTSMIQRIQGAEG